MTKYYLLIFLLWQFSVQAQTSLSDTIDYSTFLTGNVPGKAKHYSLKKIKEGKAGKELLLKPGYIWVNTTDKDFRLQDRIHLAYAGDTLVEMGWDFETAYEPYKYHTLGRLQLRQSVNLITITKLKWAGPNVEPIVERKFKILKWTATEIILKDISNFKLQRLYYFGMK
ncbi:MAG: hypothetical protein K0S33_3220 [Bacteroidetes bacterium]|nr:hypothetical protein [Bacteroidota bacterium]